MVQGVQIKMKLDTGAVFSVMDDTEFRRRFPGVVIKLSSVRLQGYFVQLSPVVGNVIVTAKYGGKAARMPLFVIQDGARALLGQSWAKAFNMPLELLVNMHQVSSVDKFVGRIESVCSKGLGTLKGVKADARVLGGARPILCRPYPILFVLQDLVAQELQWLERDRILSAVRTSEWADPRALALKKDGTIRICGDSKLTVNQVATTEVYPVPRLEEM